MLAMLMTVEVGGHVDIVSVDVDVVMFSTVTCCSGARTQERKARGGGGKYEGSWTTQQKTHPRVHEPVV